MASSCLGSHYFTLHGYPRQTRKRQKKARRLGAHLVFLDESGFLLIPNVRKTWAPVGQTPILRHSYKRDRISAISAVTVSPSRKRLGLYFRFHTTNITGVEVIGFLRHLLRHLRGPIVLLWDGGTIHKRVIVKEFLRQHKRLRATMHRVRNSQRLLWSCIHASELPWS